MATTGKSADKTGKLGEAGNVTKKHLVEAITEQTGLPKATVQRVVQGVLDQLIEAIGQGHRVELRDFGVFEVRPRAARTAQNPRTLEPVPVPPRLAVRFKPGRLMKQALDGGGAGLVDPAHNGHQPSANNHHQPPSTGRPTPVVELPDHHAQPASAMRR
ncbi:MAG: hypothetical protein KatS3mg103_0843 [Phycisphaerales bacterium]|nr:MAG: hypothetical protein KatS3mg103_0843 [Phycisphaerales bacterium]